MMERKLLIVEDECLLALSLETNLRELGYVLCGPVVSGEEAIKRTKIENPDVVLMDIHLAGEMDGIEAARQIRLFSNALIIFITGFSETGLKNRAMELNPAAYLIKPIEALQVQSILNSIH